MSKYPKLTLVSVQVLCSATARTRRINAPIGIPQWCPHAKIKIIGSAQKKHATLFNVMFCPVTKCIISGGLQEDKGIVNEDGFNESETYSAYMNTHLYMNCMNYMGYKGICKFYKENDGLSLLCVIG